MCIRDSCGLVREIPDVFEQLPHLQDRSLLFPITIPGLPEREDVHVLGAGFQFAHDGPAVTTPPPQLGQHTEEVLRALGYGDGELKAMQDAHVFGAAPVLAGP